MPETASQRNNVCLSRVTGFYPELRRFLCVTLLKMRHEMAAETALSEGQNQALKDESN